LEFEVSPDGKQILSKYWIVGESPEDIDDRYVEAARHEAEYFFRRQPGTLD
jgi:hypothetical protein